MKNQAGFSYYFSSQEPGGTSSFTQVLLDLLLRCISIPHLSKGKYNKVAISASAVTS